MQPNPIFLRYRDWIPIVYILTFNKVALASKRGVSPMQQSDMLHDGVRLTLMLQPVQFSHARARQQLRSREEGPATLASTT